MPLIYRTRESRIEAMRWTGENFEEIKKFSSTVFGPYPFVPSVRIGYPAEESQAITVFPKGSHASGQMALPGDYVIKSADDTFSVMKPDIFAATYEAVAAPTSI